MFLIRSPLMSQPLLIKSCSNSASSAKFRTLLILRRDTIILSCKTMRVLASLNSSVPAANVLMSETETFPDLLMNLEYLDVNSLNDNFHDSSASDMCRFLSDIHC
ncbi:hypothetical protein WICPIJ_005800 [Wickerhamomyces pijperi]|uniref:Uncharacterized protein n=1 Tax=Wickerhamomyces pijperi TaxID=599730 RepID=A0A9P8TLK4_WICPI|nr:hypothetical protein WICPIJ_005800 [Wickerhamomyces pijperi]